MAAAHRLITRRLLRSAALRSRRRRSFRRLDQGPQGRVERPCFDDPAAGRGEKVSPLRFAPVETTKEFPSSRPRPAGPRGETSLRRSGGWAGREGLSAPLRSGRDDGGVSVVSTKVRRAARRDLASTIRRLVVERRSLRSAALRSRRRRSFRRLDQGPQGRAERPCFDDPVAGRGEKLSPLRFASLRSRRRVSPSPRAQPRGLASTIRRLVETSGYRPCACRSSG